MKNPLNLILYYCLVAPRSIKGVFKVTLSMTLIIFLVSAVWLICKVDNKRSTKKLLKGVGRYD